MKIYIVEQYFYRDTTEIIGKPTLSLDKALELAEKNRYWGQWKDVTLDSYGGSRDYKIVKHWTEEGHNSIIIMEYELDEELE